MIPVIHRVVPYSAEWHQLRAEHVCATDMPALLGYDRDKSIKGIIASKQGEKSKSFDNVRMKAGRYLEPAAYVAMRENGMPAEPAHPKLFVFASNTDHKVGATMDGKMVVKQGFYTVEIKSTTYSDKWEEWKIKPPIKYWIQKQTQLLACAKQRGLLTCICHPLPMPIVTYKVQENYEMQDIIKQTAFEFWECFGIGKKFKVNPDTKDRVLKLYEESLQNAETYKLYVDNSPLMGLSYKEGESLCIG